MSYDTICVKAKEKNSLSSSVRMGLSVSMSKQAENKATPQKASKTCVSRLGCQGIEVLQSPRLKDY